MAESERVRTPSIFKFQYLTLHLILKFIWYLPVLIGEVRNIYEENGLRNDSIVMYISRFADYREQRWRLLGKPQGRTFVPHEQDVPRSVSPVPLLAMSDAHN